MTPALRRLAGRAAVAAGLLTATAPALPLPGAAAAEPRTVSAAAFHDSVGVGTHPTYYDTPYGQWDRVVAALRDLGVGHVRAGIYASSNAGWNARLYDALRATAAAGIDLDLVVGRDCASDWTLAPCLAAVRDQLPAGSVSALEWPNEDDLAGGTGWAPALASWGRALYAAAKADPALRAIPVLGPSLVYKASPATLGDQSAFLDAGNIHPYTGATSPNPAHIAAEKAKIAPVSGAEPVIATEAGFHTSLAFENVDQPAADEPTAAVYTLRTVLEHLADGIDRTYVYELLNTRDDPLRSKANYGLLRADFSPKPAFTALRRLLALVGRGRPASTTALDHAVASDATDLRELVVQQDERTHLVVLWRTASVWDRDARTPLEVAPATTTITVPAATAFAVGDPITGPDLAPAPAAGGRLSVPVGADPVVVQVTTGAERVAPATADTWADPAAPGAVRGDDGVVSARGGAAPRVALLKFDAGAQAPAVARLRLYALDAVPGSFSVWRTATGWTEAMTAAQLGAAAPLGTWTRVAAGVTFDRAGTREIALDASRLGPGTQSLAVVGDAAATAEVRLVASENGFGPVLGPRLALTG